MGQDVNLDDDKMLARLERLGRLKEQGALTQVEFDAEKSRLLARGDDNDVEAKPEVLGWLGPYRRHVPWAIALIAVLVATSALFGGSLISAAGKPEEKLPSASERAPTEQSRPPKAQPIVNLSFDVPSNCAPEGALADVLTAMRSLEPSPQPVELPTEALGQLAVRVQRVNPEATKGVVIAEADLQSRLEGLTVVALRTSRFGEDVLTTQVRFKESAERVRKTLNAKGYDLPAIGELRPGEIDEDKAFVIGVEEFSLGSALTCAHTVA